MTGSTLNGEYFGATALGDDVSLYWDGSKWIVEMMMPTPPYTPLDVGSIIRNDALGNYTPSAPSGAFPRWEADIVLP
jgi:hypothetical protein